MYGSPSSETLRAFERDVQEEVNAAVARVAQKHGLGGQVLVIGTSGESEEGQEAIKTLQTIRSLVN